MTPWPMLFWPRRSWQTMTKGEGGHFLDYWGNEKEVSSLNLVNIFWGTIKIKAVTHQNLFLLIPWLFTNKYLPFNFQFLWTHITKLTQRWLQVQQRASKANSPAHSRKVHFDNPSPTLPMNRAYFSKRQFLEMARLGYFLWITGSLNVSIISSLVEKKTKFLADPCTSPS